MNKKILIIVATIPSLAIAGYIGAQTLNASAPLLPTTIIQDATGNPTLSIQLAPNRPDTGVFALTISAIGVYKGTMPVQQSGPNIVHPQGTENGVRHHIQAPHHHK